MIGPVHGAFGCEDQPWMLSVCSSRPIPRKVTWRTSSSKTPQTLRPPTACLPRDEPHQDAPHIHSRSTYYVMSLLSSNVVNYLGTFPHTSVHDSRCALAPSSNPPHSLALSAGRRLRQCSAAAVALLDTRPRGAALREERRPAHAHTDSPGWHVLRPAAGKGHECASERCDAMLGHELTGID